MKVIEVEVNGISPLLQHRYPLEDSGSQTTAKNRKQQADDIEKSLYRLPDGTIYQPSIHLISTMKKAGAKYQIPGQGKLTYKNLIGSGAVIISPDAIPHRNQQYEIDVRPVVVPATRGRVARKRPVFKTWALKFTIEYDADEISAITIKEILEYAGNRVGIGDFRPEKGGPFGRFMVTNFKEQ
jgi:hypothetical protein